MIAIFVALVLLGGVKRIGQVTEKLVPGMAAIYIVCALVVVIANAARSPGVFASIFQGAFNPSAVVGGRGGRDHEARHHQGRRPRRLLQ